MLKSQLEPSSQNYETTSMFVENIFDTVKKAKAAKAAKSLAESKLMSPYQYSFGEMSPGKKKKPRKNAKKNGKIKKSPAPKKKMNLRKPKTLKDGTEKRKKTPTKSPRKYTKRIAKVPAPTDIDDEEAAFILSSISQRSFDSFYNRLNSSETNTIHIPLDLPSLSVQNLSSNALTNSSHYQDQAYYVMLDHNYWIEPKVVTKTETVKSETFISNSNMKLNGIQLEDQKSNKNRSISESTQSISETTRSVSESTQSVTESTRSVSESNDFNSPIESKQNEVNNNKLQTSPRNEIFEQEPSFIIQNTAVKKRWLRQAVTEMKTPPKKRKNMETLQPEIKREEILQAKIEPDKVQQPNIKKENESLIVVNDKVDDAKILEDERVREDEVKIKKEEKLEIKKEESPIKDLIIETKDEVPLKPCEEMKKENHVEIVQEELKAVEKILPEVQTAQEIKPIDKCAISPIQTETKVVVEVVKHEPNSDVEQDEKNWEKVMDFHKLQLKELTKANKRFTEDQKQCIDSTKVVKSVEQKRKNFTPVKSLYKRELSVHQPTAFDCNLANRSRFNLLDTPMVETCMINTDIDKYQQQRSHDEFSPTNNARKSRWGSSPAVSFVPNSFQPYTTFCRENNYPRSEPYSKTNYSNYRAQKELCTNGQGIEVDEPSWALYETQFSKLTKDSFPACARDSSFESKSVLDCTLESINIIPKKSFTTYEAVTKTKTAFSDPRLNPSLLQEKKDETLTPKKKVRIILNLLQFKICFHQLVLLSFFLALFRSVPEASITNKFN